jgi:hypothetical protein
MPRGALPPSDAMTVVKWINEIERPNQRILRRFEYVQRAVSTLAS